MDRVTSFCDVQHGQMDMKGSRGEVCRCGGAVGVWPTRGVLWWTWSAGVTPLCQEVTLMAAFSVFSM